MSEELGSVGSLHVTSFYGGKERGRCIQLTPDRQPDGYYYAQLTPTEVLALVNKLKSWLSDHLQQPSASTEGK